MEVQRRKESDKIGYIIGVCITLGLAWVLRCVLTNAVRLAFEKRRIYLENC